LTTPIGPPLSLMNPGEPEPLETRESTDGHFQSKPGLPGPVSRDAAAGSLLLLYP